MAYNPLMATPNVQSEPALADIVSWPKGQALAAVLRPCVGPVVEEMIDAIRAEIPPYDRPLRGDFGDKVRGAATRSLERFLALLAGDERDPRAHSALYVELGRGELRSGRPLDTLLSAYRIGGRVMWRRFAAEGKAAAVEPDELYRLAEALFAYVDELSAESAEGYAEEQALTNGARERERERMIEILLRRPPADAVVVQAQAARAEWLLPERFAPVALPAALRSPGQLHHRLPAGSLAAAFDGMTVALVPDLDSPGHAAELGRALGGAPAARGAGVAPAAAAEQIERVLLAARLQAAGVLPAGGVIATDDHLVDLILHRDTAAAAALADRVLAPLDALAPATRERLTDTLSAWLDHAASTTATAQAMHVHPQTMRYRLRQLEEVLGPGRLDTPDGRLELQLGLRVRGSG
ncbi:MAG: hypothetical protein QOJ07_2847, partial [Thermoleophilaceae bacterium]|nr:hypothetical protein [Thermoleophilaceae bacterium]